MLHSFIVEVPTTSFRAVSLEVVEQPLNINENLLESCKQINECDIPPVECTIEVPTSEHQQGYIPNVLY